VKTVASKGFFDPTIEPVNGLGKQDAVVFLHSVIHAELARLKLHAKVSVPFEVDIADGGIDATVEGIAVAPQSEILFQGDTFYQSKSGENVGLADAGLRKIVMEDPKPKVKRKLKPKIREIAEKNGNLVLFLPGISKPNASEAETLLLQIIREEVKDSAVNIVIVEAHKIVGILKPHFALTMQLMRGNTSFYGIPFEQWSQEKSMSNQFAHDDKRDEQIGNIRSLLSQDGVKDVRVSGFPGNGKTRSVLEAVSSPELSGQVIYFAMPSLALDSNNLQELSYRDDVIATVIIDECDRTSYMSALAIVGRSKSNLKLVTIYNEDGGEVTGDVKYVDLNTSEKLSEEAIKFIIESYGPSGEDAGRWAQFCDGSPRMAHMIGENLKRNTSDILKNPSYDAAMELCIANRDEIGSTAFNERKTVLMWLSLFTKFGWSQHVHENEREFIVAKIVRMEGLPVGKIEQIIKELKDRKILQGDKTLYISPRLLQVRAWKWWWEAHEHTFNMDVFWAENDDKGNKIAVSGELVRWFQQMFQYAAEAPGAAEVVKRLLAKDGPLENEKELIEAIGNDFFLRLTEADPEAALRVLSRWMKSKSDAELKDLTFDRQNLVRVLEAIAVWQEHFVEAARLLLRIARTETNHTYSNNSEGTFAELFSNGWGRLAPTEAAPSERLIVLKEALASNDPKEILLAIRAIYNSLETDHFTKMIGPENQGLKRQPKLWTPATWNELWEAMQSTWDLLIARIPTLEGEPLGKAIETVTERLRGLLKNEKRGLSFLDDFIKLSDKGFIPYEAAVKTVSMLLRFGGETLTDEIGIKLNEFFVRLEGDDVNGLLKRYVGTDVMEDWWGDDGEKQEATQKKMLLIAKEVLGNPKIIAENTWLFTRKAKNGYKFGRELALLDQEFVLLPLLLTEQKKSLGEHASVYFLSGYIQAMQQQSADKMHRVLDDIMTDEYYLKYIIELIWRSQLDEYSANIVTELLKSNKIDYREMATFKLGATVKNIGDATFDSWISSLLAKNDVQAHATAVDLFMSHYVFQETKQLPKELAKKVLTMKTLGSQATRQISHDIEYDWSCVAKRYIEQYPDDIDFLMDFMVRYFGRKNSVLESHHEANTVLTELAKLQPVKVWDKVASEIIKGGFEAWSLERWLQGEISFGEGRNPGAIHILDKKMLLDWIDEDPDSRAPLVARMAPQDFGFDNAPDDPSWLKIILDKYGDNKNVTSAVNSNLWTGGYSGPSSKHYAGRLEDAKRFKSLNKDSVNIQNWANEYIPGIESYVEQSKIEEERRDF
jgi:hypothetical protein